MQCLHTIVVALVLVLWAGVAAAEKPLPPAFSKGFVPDKQTDQRREPAETELAEPKKKPEKAPRPGGHVKGKGARLDADADDDDLDDTSDDDL